MNQNPQQGSDKMDQISQGGSEKSDLGLREKTKRKQGHMALRNNVWTIRVQLWKELRPLEMCLLDIIIDKTIGWRTDEAPIQIGEFMERSGQKHPHIYKALKTLEDRGVIIRRKKEHRVFYSLREDYFGELLIKKHQDELRARRSKIKVVVDNSKSVYGNGTSSVPNPYKPCTESVQPLTEIGTSKPNQNIETVRKFDSLKTFLKDIQLNTILKDSNPPKPGPQESYTLVKKPGAETPEEIESEKARQRREHEKFMEKLLAMEKLSAQA